MNFEYLVVSLVLLSFLIIAIQVIWLYYLSVKQETHLNNIAKIKQDLKEMILAIMNSPNQQCLDDEIAQMDEYLSDDILKIDIITEYIVEILISDDATEDEKRWIVYLYEKIDPIKHYIMILEKGSTYEKAYACLKIATFSRQDQVENIKKYIHSRNKDLAYCSSMALSILGDEDSMVEIILKCSENYQYSHRVILEFLDEYTGDLSALARRVLDKCNDYIKSAVIKALSNYKLEEFEKVYIDGLRSKSVNLKIACIRALGKIGKLEYERHLITATNDIEWTVRSAAVQSLSKIPTENSVNAVANATTDAEWWVRYNAAKTLVDMPNGLNYAERILNGYDKYAAEAVKYVLYKRVEVAE